jgi:hypothetical protein
MSAAAAAVALAARVAEARMSIAANDVAREVSDADSRISIAAVAVAAPIFILTVIEEYQKLNIQINKKSK